MATTRDLESAFQEITEGVRLAKKQASDTALNEIQSFRSALLMETVDEYALPTWIRRFMSIRNEIFEIIDKGNAYPTGQELVKLYHKKIETLFALLDEAITSIQVSIQDRIDALYRNPNQLPLPFGL